MSKDPVHEPAYQERCRAMSCEQALVDPDEVALCMHAALCHEAEFGRKINLDAAYEAATGKCGHCQTTTANRIVEVSRECCREHIARRLQAEQAVM
jgi:hypothetical protein